MRDHFVTQLHTVLIKFFDDECITDIVKHLNLVCSDAIALRDAEDDPMHEHGEVVSIVPASEVKDLQPGPDAAPSSRAGSKVEMLKGNEYLRVWINRAGVNYLIHMPPA